MEFPYNTICINVVIVCESTKLGYLLNLNYISV